MEVSGQLYAPDTLPPDGRLGGPQSRSGRRDEYKKISSLALLGKSLCRPACSLVTIPNELL